MSSSASQSTSGNVTFGDPEQSKLWLWLIGAAAVVAVIWLLKRK